MKINRVPDQGMEEKQEEKRKRNHLPSGELSYSDSSSEDVS
jgi:hypothetical protein